MDKEYPFFLWSDNWTIEGDKAWFVAEDLNTLFQVDLNTYLCKYIAELPKKDLNGFRLNSRCIKCGNDIYCMPDTGDCIWVYQIDNSSFYQIMIDNADGVELNLANFWEYKRKIYAVSIGSKKIIEIDVDKKKVENCYSVCDTSKIEIALSIKVGAQIYITSAISNHIYQFDIETKKIVEYEVPNTKDRFFAISFDGNKFWISGYHKAIYLWNKDENNIIVIKNFPHQYGLYNLKNSKKGLIDYEKIIFDDPIFHELVVLGQYIWCIPRQSNKILYINKDTYEICILDIAEENETIESINQKRLKHKYILEYILENQYIGLYSTQNDCIVEIDTLNKSVKRKKFKLDTRSLQKILKMYEKNRKVFYEKNNLDKKLYEMKLLEVYKDRRKENKSNIGLNVMKNVKDI